MKDFRKLANSYRSKTGSLNNANGPVIRQSFIGQSNSFMGQRINYADGSATDAGLAGTSKLSDGDKFYTAVLTNTNTGGDPVSCTVFGADIYGISNDQGPVNAPTPNGTGGALVVIEETSHSQVRAQSLSSPFWVNGLRYMVATQPQLNKLASVQMSQSSGSFASQQFRPLSYKSAAQLNSLQVDAPTFQFGVNGSISFVVPVIANEQVTITFQIGGRFEPSNIVDNQSPIAVANQAPLPTGLTTVNIVK